MTTNGEHPRTGEAVEQPAPAGRAALFRRITALRDEGYTWAQVASTLSTGGASDRSARAIRRYWRYHAARRGRNPARVGRPSAQDLLARIVELRTAGVSWPEMAAVLAREEACSSGQIRIVVALQARGTEAIAAALAAAREEPLPDRYIGVLIGSPDLPAADPLTSLLLELAAQRHGYDEIVRRLAAAGFPRLTANSISIRLRRLGQGRPRNASRRYDRGNAVEALLRFCFDAGLDADATLARLEGAGHHGWNRRRIGTAMKRIAAARSYCEKRDGRRRELERMHELRQAGLNWSEVAAQMEADGLPRYRTSAMSVRYARHKHVFASGKELPRWDVREVLVATELAARSGDHAAIAGELARRGFPHRPAVAIRWILASLSRVRPGRKPPGDAAAAAQSGWSLDELQYLRDHYGRATTAEIACALGRRSTEVYRVATGLALKARRRGRRRKEELVQIAGAQSAAPRRPTDARQGLLL